MAKADQIMRGVTVISHPLIQHNLTLLRDQSTGSPEFRRVLGEVAALMIYEATRSFEVETIRVQTPITKATGHRLKREIVLVPVLRAGLGMLDPILKLIPHARVGFIGLKREEKTLKASFYHKSLPPDLRPFEVILVDPMLATGGSALAALQLLHDHGAKRIRLVSLLSSPAGIKTVRAAHPKLPIFTAAVDERLDKRGFIVPGLGDAGDRLFGV